MPQPTPYTRQANFTDFEASNPTTPKPGASLDAEFDALKVTTDGIRTNLAKIQRDDGALKNASVGRDQLRPDVVAGINTPAGWVTATSYSVRDSVFFGDGWYWCVTAHTSGTFATDLAAGKWSLINDFTAPVATATDAATAAAASASAAAESEANADADADATAADRIAVAADRAAVEADAATVAADKLLVEADKSAAEAAAAAAAVSEGNAADSATAAAQSAADAAAIAGGANVKVSSGDTTPGYLDGKLVAGSNITLTKGNAGGNETLTVGMSGVALATLANVGNSDFAAKAAAAGVGVDAALLARILSVEYNLATAIMRAQIAEGWSVWHLVGGVADEFEDETGVATKTNIVHDSSGSYFRLSDGSYTSDITSGGTAGVTGGTITSGVAADAFDGSTSTPLTIGGLATNAIIYYDFGSGVTKRVRRWTLTQYTSANYKVPSAVLVYSDNGSTWTEVGTSAAMTTTDLATTTTDTSDEGAHRYWGVKLTGASPGGSGFGQGVADLAFMEVIPTPSGTLTSIAYTAAAAPSTIRATLLHQPIDSVTLNTDFVLSVSRDGGTTWTAATLVNQLALDATMNVLTASVDVSAQPSGTSVKWKAEFANSKNQRLHGVTLQWG